MRGRVKHRRNPEEGNLHKSLGKGPGSGAAKEAIISLNCSAIQRKLSREG